MTRTIDLTPTWPQAARIIAAALENGTGAGREAARTELYRMAEILDRMQKPDDTAPKTAAAISAMLAERLDSFATVEPKNAAAFTVRGWPFAIIRNGCDKWDLAHPFGLLEAVPTQHLAQSVAGYVEDAEADNAGWNETATSVLKPDPQP